MSTPANALSTDNGSTCIGVDVGGTFTDAVLTVGERTWRAKSPTTTGRLADGVLAAAELVAQRCGSTLADLLPRVDRFGLGTTAVTNMLASRTGSRVGLLVTRGFADMILHASGMRVLDDEGWAARRPRSVAREAIVEVDERIDRDGRVLTPIDLPSMLDGVDRIVAPETENGGVEAVAVSYLWSFLNPVHEQATVEAIRHRHPNLAVVSGAALHPAIREYERTTVAVLNAYVSGALPGIEDLEARLRAQGLVAPLLLVHSGGGSISVAEARRQPLGLAVSGPAAGVSAAIGVGAAAGHGSVVTCDMGGTSFDVSVVVDGHAARRSARCARRGVDGALGRRRRVDRRGGRLDRLGRRPRHAARRTPVGRRRSGPRATAAAGRRPRSPTRSSSSASSIPRTSSVGRSGSTRVPRRRVRAPRYRIGSVGRGRRRGACARSRTGMAKATRARLASLGLDPASRRSSASGAAARCSLRTSPRSIGAPRCSCRGSRPCSPRSEPRRPTCAASGSAPCWRRSRSRRRRSRSSPASSPTAVDADLEHDGVERDDRSIAFEVDMRFAKQVFELQVPLPSATPDGAAPDAEMMDAVGDAFRPSIRAPLRIGLHRPRFADRAGRAAARSGRGRRHAPISNRSPDRDTGAPPASARPQHRACQLDRGAQGRHDVAVHELDDLRRADTLAGPALVDGTDTTVWIPPRHRPRRRLRHAGPGGQPVKTIDPIELEVLRTRLEAVGEQAAAAVEHTAISPTVTEAKDYSVTLLDASGGLVVGHRSGPVPLRCRDTRCARRSSVTPAPSRPATCSWPTTRTTAAGSTRRT